MGIFNKKLQSFLGVDIGAGGIKLVELQNNKKRPQLWTYAIADGDLDIHRRLELDKESIDLPGGTDIDPLKRVEMEKVLRQERIDKSIDDYSSILRAVVKKSKAVSNIAIASLPISSVFHAVINLPKVPEKELQHHIEAKTKKMLPRPLEDMQLVYQVIPDDKKANDNIRVLVTAAPRDLVAFYSQVFTRAGLVLSELETEAFALERSLVGRDKSTVMVVDIGAERTNFFIMDMGLPVTHRSLELGGNNFNSIVARVLGVDEREASLIKSDISRMSKNQINDEIFLPIIDPIIKEIQYGFDIYMRQTGNEYRRPEKIILTGGPSMLPSVTHLIEKSFDMKVFVGDPWARVVYQQGLSPLLRTLGPRMSVSIGLALKNIL